MCNETVANFRFFLCIFPGADMIGVEALQREVEGGHKQKKYY